MKLNFSGIGFLEPFPHTTIDNFIDRETIRAINEEWPDEGWDKEDGKFTRKWSSQQLPPTALKLVEAVNAHLPEIERLTGISGLIPDPDLIGAGLHSIPQGGFLKMHCDFNGHPKKPWTRRVNVLIYLNEDWGGELVLAKNPKDLGQTVKILPPIAGRCVIFDTNDGSWHGHPFKLECPKTRQRRSLAMYFYTEGKPNGPIKSTTYIK